MSYLTWIEDFNSKISGIGRAIDNFITIAQKIHDVMNEQTVFECLGEKFGKWGWGFPLSMNLEDIAKLIDITNQDCFDEEMIRYFESNLKEIIYNIEQSTIDQYLKDMFRQSYEAFSLGLLHPALTSITAIADGILFDSNEDWDKKNTKFIERAKALEKRQKYDDPSYYLNITQMKSIRTFTEVCMKYVPFTEDEPNMYNRHWLIHGTTRRTLSKREYFQVLSWVDSLTSLLFSNDSK